MQNIDDFFKDNEFKFPETDLLKKEKLLSIGDYHWSTLKDSPPAYLIETFLEGLEKAQGDFLLVTHEGHGTDSWFFHYYSLDESLAYFMQLPLGNANGIIENERNVIAGGLLTLDMIRKNLLSVPRSQRMVVVDSTIAGRRWAWQENGKMGAWNTVEPILTALQASVG